MRHRNRTSSALAQLELFDGCHAGELAKLGSLMTMVTVPAGQVLIRQGRTGAEFVVIASGRAEVTKTGKGGVSTVAELHDGGFVGEIALLEGVPRTATVTATTDLTAYVSNAAEFREILRTVPTVAERVARASRLRSGELAAAA